MRDQQSNPPSGVRMRVGMSQYEGGTKGSVRNVTPSEIRRGWSSEYCDSSGPYTVEAETNTYSDEPGGFLGRSHGMER